MNKPEIREYLTKIYNLPVKKVMTANFLGETIFLHKHVFTYMHYSAGMGLGVGWMVHLYA